MNCVECKEPMVVLELDQVEIDYCLECGGLWLDHGELEILLGNPEKAGRLLDEAGKADRSSKSKRKCPLCKKGMDLIVTGGDKEVRIDRCPKGHGLWFDRGELKEVIQGLSGVDNHKVVELLEKMFNQGPDKDPDNKS
ncbi:MAG: zf-TFIIB domain-containing protein [Planctomycetes bacterium]|nr:zf-TFIIB domain-containing protein [Planctomycetota bacterium]